ncbi:MAG: hypothetical protein ABSB82_24485 [Terriglobia bacterium]|jgi:hypothetical protein
MPTHHGSAARIGLGAVGPDTQHRLEEVKAKWLEFCPNPPSLLVRRAQPGVVSSPREVAGEALEFLGQLPENRRNAAALDALRRLDDATGRCLLRLLKRLRDLEGTLQKRRTVSSRPRTATKSLPTA